MQSKVSRVKSRAILIDNYALLELQISIKTKAVCTYVINIFRLVSVDCNLEQTMTVIKFPLYNPEEFKHTRQLCCWRVHLEVYALSLLLDLHNTGEHDQMQHHLLDPGEPIGTTDATEVDGKDIEDDDQGEPENQDGQMGDFGNLVGNQIREELGAQKQTADQLQCGDEVEKQLAVAAEHVGKFTGNLVAQSTSRGEPDDSHRNKQECNKNLQWLFGRNCL